MLSNYGVDQSERKGGPFSAERWTNLAGHVDQFSALYSVYENRLAKTKKN